MCERVCVCAFVSVCWFVSLANSVLVLAYLAAFQAQLSIACQTERDLRQQVGSLQDDISQLQCCLSESKEETAEAVDRLHVVEILLTRQREDALAASRKAGETAEQVRAGGSQTPIPSFFSCA